MKLKVSDYTELIENENYETTELKIKQTDLKSNKDVWNEIVEFSDNAINSGKLFHITVNVGDPKVPFRVYFESDIINLPFENYKKVKNFFNEDDEVETHVYMMTESEYINASKYRIEKITDDDTLSTGDLDTVSSLLEDQVKQMQDNLKESSKKKADKE